MWKISLFICAIFAGNYCEAVLPSHANTLVLIDNLVIRETHSIFFSTLEERGFKLTFKLADDASIFLSRYGVYEYKNVIIFAPNVEEFGGDISIESLAEFVDNGGNILVATNENSAYAVRELATEFGFEVDEEDTVVIDHLHHNVADKGNHTLILTGAENLVNAPTIVGAKNREIGSPSLLYQGTSLVLDKENPLVLKLLTAEASAYSHKLNQLVTESPHAVGKGTLLIAGLQARNNARVVFCGSLYFFSDEAFSSAVQDARTGKSFNVAGNRAVAVALSKWAFGESGSLRITSVRHHREGEENPPDQAYTIMDNVVYETVIQELVNDKWQPLNAKDIQLEFVRIDPFVRTTLKHVKNGKYVAKFKIPDVYGVYQFKVDYDRIGYAHLYNTTQVSVRPLEHTQYERFIASAYPYYVSSFSMMFGVFLLSFVFLHFKEGPAVAAGKAANKEKKN